jgi:hypothetical protein
VSKSDSGSDSSSCERKAVKIAKKRGITVEQAENRQQFGERKEAHFSTWTPRIKPDAPTS